MYNTYLSYPGNEQDVTDFLSQLCSDYHVSESEKIHRLPCTVVFCQFFFGKVYQDSDQGEQQIGLKSDQHMFRN